MFNQIARISAVWVGLLFACIAQAGIIQDTVTVKTEGQGMWDAGPEAVFSEEAFLGTKWGTYDGGPAERVSEGAIFGEENSRVPGTGGTIPNPARVLWDGAMATCQLLSSYSTCVNGTSAVRACAPSWLGGGCTTVIPAVPGLGNPPSATIDNPIGAQFVDTRTGLEGGLETSGEVGLIPWVEASGGAINVDLGFDATIEIPDQVQTGQAFTLETGVTYSDPTTQITAEAPTFKAGVDGIFNSENKAFGTACIVLAGCATGDTGDDLDVKLGRFGIVAIDTSEDNFLRVLGDGGPEGNGSIGVPGIAFDQQYNFYAPTPENPDGVDDETTPKKIPSPRIGDIMVSNPDDITGGVVTADGKINMLTNQQLLSLNASITGLTELSLGSPGILSNKIEIVGPISLEYTLLDVAAGPRIGMEQEFELDPNARVRLEFDTPVVRKNPDTVETQLVGTGNFTQRCIYKYLGICFGYELVEIFDTVTTTIPGDEILTNIIDIALGEAVELRFDGPVGNLVNREYYLSDPNFSNRTAATLDPGLKVEIGCIGVPGIDRLCVLNEDFKTTSLIDITVFDKSWTLDGFNTKSFTDMVALAGDQTSGNGGPTAVPEPSTLLLLAFGLLAIYLRSSSQGSYRRSVI